jgi:hypothetical protein
VARALGTLPLLAQALARGELSYAKVRALARVATPETEERLLAVGRAGTADHVERIVRGWRRMDRKAAEAAEEDVSAETSTMAQRQADALALLAETALHHGIDPGTPGERYQVVVHVDAPVLADPDASGESVLEDSTHVSAKRRGAWPNGSVTVPSARARWWRVNHRWSSASRYSVVFRSFAETRRTSLSFRQCDSSRTQK